MNTPNEQNRTNKENGVDKNIDVTRSENRQAATAAGNDTGEERMGSLSEAGNEHSHQGHTGSHQEGQYDKDHQESQNQGENQELNHKKVNK